MTDAGVNQSGVGSFVDVSEGIGVMEGVRLGVRAMLVKTRAMLV